MFYGANFTTGSLSDGEPVQPFTLTLWLAGSSVFVPYKTMDGFCNRYEQCRNPQCTDFDDHPDASAYEGDELVSFYDNGSRVFDVYADLIAQVTLDASDVKVWTTNAFDGFFGTSTAFGDRSRSPVNRSIASVLLSRTCEEGYTANAGYITYGRIHPLCNVVGYTPTYNGTEGGFPSVRITTIRNGKNSAGGQSGVATLDSLTQDIVLPKAVFDKLKLNATSTERGFTVDCDSRPEIAFSFNATGEFAVTARELMYKASDGQCYLQVRPHNNATDGANYILGLPFLRQFCVAFDLENSRIGIGNHKAGSSEEICHYLTPLPSTPQRQCAAMKRQMPSAAVSRYPLILSVMALLAVVALLS